MINKIYAWIRQNLVTSKRNNNVSSDSRDIQGILIHENSNFKIIRSKDYNYNFNKKTGFFVRWGRTLKEDSVMAPFNEILDIEVTDICKGPGGIPCSFCYKSNSPNNKSNMSFEMFKTIIDKMKEHNIINQLAFGADAQAESNPDLWKMAKYSRDNGIIPNITVADISDNVADKLVNVMGAVAVSRYSNKNYCYNSVKKLVDRGMKQCNIHQLVAVETFDQIKETFIDYKTDARLKGLNAIILLSLKKKGRGENYNSLSNEQFKEIINLSFEHSIPVGMDSCSCHKFLSAIKDRKDYEKLVTFTEPCESSLMSFYINSIGQGFPCSFSEGVGDWKEGLDVVKSKNFNAIWFNSKLAKFRDKLLSLERQCPLYSV